MTPQPERERIEEIVQIFQHEYGQYTSLEALSIASDWLRNTLHQELQKAREEENEACAVTVWNYLATFEDCLEPTQRTNALNHAIKLIRKRKIIHSELDQTITNN